MTTIVFGHRPRAVVLRQVAGIIFLRLVLIILLRLFPRLVLLLLWQLQKWKASARKRTDACTHPSLYFRSGRMR